MAAQPGRSVEPGGGGLVVVYTASVMRFAALAIASRSLFRVAARFLPQVPVLGFSSESSVVVAEATAESWELMFAATLHVFSSFLCLASSDASAAPVGKQGSGLIFAQPPSPKAQPERSSTPSDDDMDNEESRPDLRSCTFACVGPRRRGGEVDEFAPRLQKLIEECRRVRDDGARFRIFDDCTVEGRSRGGSHMQLTETRCTPFRRLRQCSGLSEDEFYNSMCAQPFSGGTVEVSGKSGSIFLRTHDNHLVLKTIEEHEFEVLKQILPHMLLYLEHHPSSLLCRFLGAYALTIDRTTLRFVVMANVLPRKAEQVYDLKGTTEDRWVDPNLGGVLKDLNFGHHRMSFEPTVRSQLVQALCDDADFLESLGTMDYSLLVGVTRARGPVPVDEWLLSTQCRGLLLGEKGEKVEVDFQLGVIDFLQRWTPKKVAAHWFKKATIGCIHEIDTEPPTVYCQRFSKFLVRKIVAEGVTTL